MKFNFDIKNKKGGFEADIEKIVEKVWNNTKIIGKKNLIQSIMPKKKS